MLALFSFFGRMLRYARFCTVIFPSVLGIIVFLIPITRLDAVLFFPPEALDSSSSNHLSLTAAAILLGIFSSHMD